MAEPLEFDDDNEEIFVNLEFERQLLKYIATKDFSIALDINPDVFDGEAEKIIFPILQKLQTHFPEENVRDVILEKTRDSDFDMVETGLDDILNQPDLPTYKSAKNLLESLNKLYQQRMFRDVGYQLIGLSSSGSIDEAFTLIRQSLSSSTDKIEIGDYLEDFEHRYKVIEQREQQKNEKSDIIPLGIKNFDDIAGGLMKGEVGVLLGHTGGGKSIGKLNFACNAWFHDYNVIHIGLEMTKIENEFRFDTMLTQIPAKLFRLAELSEDQKARWKATIEQLRKERENYIEFVGGKSLYTEEVFSIIEGIEGRRGKADLIVLDHIVLLKRGGRQDFHMKQWDNFQEISDYAKTRNQAWWTSSQSTDEGMKRKEGMKVTDVKYSRAIAELAQIIIAQWQSEIDKESGDLNFKVIKGRGIKAGENFILRPDFSHMILDTLSFYTTGISKLKSKAGNEFNDMRL